MSKIENLVVRRMTRFTLMPAYRAVFWLEPTNIKAGPLLSHVLTWGFGL